MKSQPTVLYYVQHLLGVGHVFRTMRITAALVRAGFRVELIYGGEKLPHFDDHGALVHFLPPLTSSKGDFSNLVTGDGSIADDAYRVSRREKVLNILKECSPDILVTEAFPFGRRQMHFELLPLMEAAIAMQPRPKIFASVRDILQEGNKPSKDRQSVDLLRRYFDAVLVHGDDQLVDLSATFPLVDEISDLVHYTGIVTPQLTDEILDADDQYDVVVSAGGGLLGRELLFAAAEAKAMSPLSDARWCLLTGPFGDAGENERLAGYGLTVLQFVPDLYRLLKTARLSVSLAGYNTVADIMAAGCRCIMAPQWNDKETEQLRRAQLLDARGLAVMLPHEEKTPSALCEAIERTLALPAPDWNSIRQNGAEETVRYLHKALAGSDAFRK
ncbi:glycosyltransferase family protein [Hoeflea poritis]|uniref:Glycosyltransferase n=1 Tax=Hoeflea poritis TaxID=2993659 RepID=A0ABT4VGF9_9HYPH|nr:glycosyltransferase [Hoeflea poritis]MDA4843791.1 glycosyltransferase [Hoeflea poritis]